MSNREIGGYFGIESFTGSEYYPEAVATNCFRSSVKLLLDCIKPNRLLSPKFNCGEVNSVLESKCPVEYYSVGSNLLPLLPEDLSGYDAVLINNSFGRVPDEYIIRLHDSCRCHIIVDNTQDFFRKPCKGSERLHYINSCRKFFGVPDGSYLITQLDVKAPETTATAADSMSFIAGRLEDGASSHYAEMKQNEERITASQPMAMSAFTHNILRGVDYGRVIELRNRNYGVLQRHFGEQNSFPLLEKLNGPFMYPLYTEQASQLRGKLAAEKIYIPTLWPNTLQLDMSSTEYLYTANLLVLPCDQRYSVEDMEYMAQKIRSMI